MMTTVCIRSGPLVQAKGQAPRPWAAAFIVGAASMLHDISAGRCRIGSVPSISSSLGAGSVTHEPCAQSVRTHMCR